MVVKTLQKSILILVIAVIFNSCSYLRETPSYRETPRDETRRQSQSRRSATITETRQFYETKSQRLGYALNGNENPELLTEIVAWLGTPYRHGGTTRSGVDCSGLATHIYRKVYNIDLSRATVDMTQRTRKVNRRQLKEGDLVFFKINNRKISHVGVYISNNRFVHSSTSRGVIISSLDEEYYDRRFAYGGRVLKK